MVLSYVRNVCVPRTQWRISERTPLNKLRRVAYRSGRLSALSPLAVLDRGYSITHKLPEGGIVKTSASLQTGDLVRITFAEGNARCRVEEG